MSVRIRRANNSSRNSSSTNRPSALNRSRMSVLRVWRVLLRAPRTFENTPADAGPPAAAGPLEAAEVGSTAAGCVEGCSPPEEESSEAVAGVSEPDFFERQNAMDQSFLEELLLAGSGSLVRLAPNLSFCWISPRSGRATPAAHGKDSAAGFG